MIFICFINYLFISIYLSLENFQHTMAFPGMFMNNIRMYNCYIKYVNFIIWWVLVLYSLSCRSLSLWFVILLCHEVCRAFISLMNTTPPWLFEIILFNLILIRYFFFHTASNFFRYADNLITFVQIFIIYLTISIA